jgi:hypothetical protein
MQMRRDREPTRALNINHWAKGAVPHPIFTNRVLAVEPHMSAVVLGKHLDSALSTKHHRDNPGNEIGSPPPVSLSSRPSGVGGARSHNVLALR